MQLRHHNILRLRRVMLFTPDFRYSRRETCLRIQRGHLGGGPRLHLLYEPINPDSGYKHGYGYHRSHIKHQSSKTLTVSFVRIWATVRYAILRTRMLLLSSVTPQCKIQSTHPQKHVQVIIQDYV